MNRKAQRLNRTRRFLTKGTSTCPRVSIEKTNKHLGWQLIDDSTGKTLAQATTKGTTAKEGTPTNLGEQLAKAAKELGVEEVVFDRRGHKYHGQIATLAEAARKNGLNF